MFIRNIFATAASEKKEDDINSSDPAISDARDIFKFLDENNNSTAASVEKEGVRVAVGVSQKNLDATAVWDGNEEDAPRSSDPSSTIIDVPDIDVDLINQPTQLLSFPFLGGALVEQAAQGLNLCDPMQDFITADLITM